MIGTSSRPAVFIDRDGTLIELVHHLDDPADVQLIDHASDAVAALRSAGFAVVIITNQSVIGRGKLSEAGLADIHRHLSDLLAWQGTAVDGMYHCPLAPTIKDPTVIEDPMRKPGPGMLLQAATELNLDLAQSWMIGDTVSDLLAGRNAGCRGTILVETGYGDSYAYDPTYYDHRARDLRAAADFILNTMTANKDRP